MTRGLVSLVIPNMNNGPALDLFFERLERNTTYPDFEIVVVDDGSTDSSLRVLRRWRDSGRFPEFKLVESEHRGIIDTLNEALLHVRGELVVRMDGDATVETPGWLERMIRLHDTDPSVGVVAGGVDFDSGLVHAYGVNCICPEGFHDRPAQIIEPVGRRTMHGKVLRPIAADMPASGPVEVDGAIGCLQLFSAELAHEIGGWDTGFSPVWFEDVDFTLEARRRDRKVFVMPEVRVLHRLALRNPRTVNPRRTELMLRSLNRAIGRYVPQPVKDRVTTAARLAPELDPQSTALMRRHYAYWREKWGFDMLNPDMDDVRRRYEGTELWWAHDDERREHGRRIAEAYSADYRPATSR
jgi:GT2 family glycosyltransferase